MTMVVKQTIRRCYVIEGFLWAAKIDQKLRFMFCQVDCRHGSRPTTILGLYVRAHVSRGLGLAAANGEAGLESSRDDGANVSHATSGSVHSRAKR